MLSKKLYNYSFLLGRSSLLKCSINRIARSLHQQASSTSPLATEGSSSPTPIRIAIVGGGPGGFYTANHLLKKFPQGTLSIDMFELWPTPFGLVRFGVAPDHQEVKLVTNKFSEVARHPDFNFFGNVKVGDHRLPIATLQAHYAVVVLAYGADLDRKLGIPGEQDDFDNSGVFPARTLVNWYNGLPSTSIEDHQKLVRLLSSSDTAIILGQGNVSLDLARILLKPIEQLAHTDLTQPALQGLSTSRVQHVHIVGRRGPLQVSFTTKELKELFKLPNTKVQLDMELLDFQIQANHSLLSTNRPLSRLMKVLKQGIQDNIDSPYTKTITFHFLKSPTEFIKSIDNRSMTLRLQRNKLSGCVTRPSTIPLEGQIEELSSNLVFTSIGYKVQSMQGVPLDNKFGYIPNSQGRVLINPEKNAEAIPGLYVSGWVKTGPVGVLVSTLMQAQATSDSIINDIKSHPSTLNLLKCGLTQHQLIKMGFKPTSFSDWSKLDCHEVAMGQELGKPREKVVQLDQMLDIIHKN